jgi:hypothetical protein
VESAADHSDRRLPLGRGRRLGDPPHVSGNPPARRGAVTIRSGFGIDRGRASDDREVDGGLARHTGPQPLSLPDSDPPVLW